MKLRELTEAADEAPAVSMFRRLEAAGVPVYFVNRSGTPQRITRMKTGMGQVPNGRNVPRKMSEVPAAWFYGKNENQPITWKTGANLEKLHITKSVIDGEKVWVLYDKTVHPEGLKEEDDTPFVVKMLNKLKDEVKNMRVYYVSPGDTKRKLMYRFETETAQTMGGAFLDITVAAPNPNDYRQWKASLPFFDIDEKYTIKSDIEHGQKIWILQPKGAQDEAE